MNNFTLSRCTASIRIKPHEDCPTRLFYIKGAVKHPTFGEIASLRGFFLAIRYAWKQAGDFAEIMDDQSDEMMHFSSDIFDPNFNVHTWLVDGSRRSGSGCWGSELNSGDVVYVEDITVMDKFRRRGVGSMLLRQLFASPDIFPPFSILGDPHIYCWPTGEGLQSQKKVLAFFRKNRFRRVGLTNFLCYSSDPNHPSRHVAIKDDPDLPTRHYINAANVTPYGMERVYPLHCAISSKKGPEVMKIIKSAYKKDPASIHRPGQNGFTPIHIAAEHLNIHAIRVLLDFGVAEDLKNIANQSGRTPFETFSDTLRLRRNFADDIWNGYSTEVLAVEYALKSASKIRLSPSSEKEYIAKRKLGCTCGHCTHGWLSPRMRHRLRVSAIVQFDTDTLELESLDRRVSAEDYLSAILTLEYLPEALRRKVNKGFCTDYISMFHTIHDILETPGAVPSATSVSSHTGAFLYTGRGGKAEYALDAVIGIARDQSPLGDNSFDAPHGEENESFGPRCDNDLAFGLVRRKVGLDPRKQWGPYV